MTTIRRLVRAVLLGAGPCIVLAPRVARAEDGGNAVCPAVSVEADDVRERYDADGRLVHQLRLHRGRDVQEIAIAYRDGHAVARTEAIPGHQRIARTTWDGDQVVAAECVVDGVLTARAVYRYEGDRLVSIEKRFAGAPTTASESTRFFYDADGRPIATEVRGADGRRISITHADRAAPAVPIRLSLTAGGSYQSDTDLYDAAAGIGIYRDPKTYRYGSDPLEVSLEGAFRFNRAAGVTTTDQTTVRFSADYHYLLPRITLFTFTSTERNLPANLRLNLEQAVLGVKVDIVALDRYRLDASLAPIWNYRSITSPDTDTDGETLQNTSKLRGSFRARAGLHWPSWSLVDTFEFLPTLFGDDVAEEDSFWNRTVLRNTVRLDVHLMQHLVFREEFKYTRDPSMRAQADCADSENPLCRGEAFASTTSLVLNVDL